MQAFNLNIESALDALYGPLYGRLFAGLAALSPRQVDGYLDIVLRGIFQPPPGPPTDHAPAG